MSKEETFTLSFWYSFLKDCPDANLFDWCLTPDSFKNLGEALKTNQDTKSLYVSYDDSGDCIVQYLSEALKVNETLERLYIVCCNIRDPGAIALSEMLRTNKTLLSLNIASNYITDIGGEALYESLKTNTTLTHLDISNSDIEDKKIVSGIQREIEENKCGKKKWRFEYGTLFLICRELQEDSLFYKDYLPLDLFKKIWVLSRIPYVANKKIKIEQFD